MIDTIERLPWQVGDRVSRMCARKVGGHIVTAGMLKTGTVTHCGPKLLQVEWDDGKRAKYDPDGLTYIPIGKEKK